MRVKLIDINDVIPYPGNPRYNEISIAKVAASIETFGWQQPLVLDKKMVIIAGHTRYHASLLLGIKQIPVHIANLSATEARAYRLADNRLHEDAEWNNELLTLELNELNTDDFNLELTGFDRMELEKLLGSNNDEKTPATCELSQADFNEFTCQCPRCGFEWDEQKKNSTISG